MDSAMAASALAASSGRGGVQDFIGNLPYGEVRFMRAPGAPMRGRTRIVLPPNTIFPTRLDFDVLFRMSPWGSYGEDQEYEQQASDEECETCRAE
jgi:hypothetical protein